LSTDNHIAYSVEAGKQERDGRRTIILRHDGAEVLRDYFRPDEHWKLGKFCEAAAEKLAASQSRVPTDDDLAGWDHETGIETVKPDMRWLSAKVLAAAQQADGGGDGQLVYPQLSCAQLADAQYKTEYLIEGALVAGQPCVIAGPKKALKTSTLIDMGMSLATGTPFLGRLAVSRAVRVGIMSGESGMATIQETAFRVARAKEIDLRDISGMVWSDAIPQFGSLPHMDATTRFLVDNEIEVLFIDPAYLAMPGGDAGNLFVQGELLRTMNKLCQDCGAQLVLAHHTRKNVADPMAPAELEDIAWAGFQEWVRQWCLLSRREPYEPGTGEHRLWLNLGGSAGHSALWAVDVSEGVYDGGRTPRRWCVDVMRAEEARKEVQDRQEGEKQVKQDAKAAADHQRLLTAAAKFPEGETLNIIKQRAGLSGARAQLALTAALDAGHIIPCEVLKGGRTTPRDGFRLADGDA
jgi:hypothetical protein